jgi:hypothetical protein
MSVEVDYFHFDGIFQADEFVDWTWPLPTGNYWSCAVIPDFANVGVLEITRFFWSTDNSLNLTANFTIRARELNRPGGVIFGFKAIRAPGF